MGIQGGTYLDGEMHFPKLQHPGGGDLSGYLGIQAGGTCLDGAMVGKCRGNLRNCYGVAWPGLVIAWPGLVMAWPGLVVAWPGLVKAWPGLVIAWPGLGMAWPDLDMAWPGLAIS